MSHKTTASPPLSVECWDCGGVPATFKTKNPRSLDDEDTKFSCVFGVVTGERFDTEHFPELLNGLCENLAKVSLAREKTVRVKSAEEIGKFLIHLKSVTDSRVAQSLDCSDISDLFSEVLRLLERLPDIKTDSQQH